MTFWEALGCFVLAVMAILGISSLIFWPITSSLDSIEKAINELTKQIKEVHHD